MVNATNFTPFTEYVPNPSNDPESPKLLRRALRPPPVRPHRLRRRLWAEAVASAAPGLDLEQPCDELLEALQEKSYARDDFLPLFDGLDRRLMTTICATYIALGELNGV